MCILLQYTQFEINFIFWFVTNNEPFDCLSRRLIVIMTDNLYNLDSDITYSDIKQYFLKQASHVIWENFMNRKQFLK